MRALVLLPTLFVLLAPALALAAGEAEAGGHGGPDWSAIVRHSVNLLILMGVLWTFLKRPVGDYLKFRRNEVKDQLETSALLKTDAEGKYAELQERLEHFDVELQGMLDAVASDAEAERVRLIAASERGAAHTVAAARTTAQEELRRARLALQVEAIELAVGMATTSLTGAVGATDQGRLNAAYLEQVERNVAG